FAMSAFFFFFSSRRRHTRFSRDWSSDVCSSDLLAHAYRAYEEVGRSNPAAAGGSWVGVLYHDAELALTEGGSAGSSLTFTGDLAWTSAGATTYLTGAVGDANGELHIGGWRFTEVTDLVLLVVDGQVVRFTRPHGKVYV